MIKINKLSSLIQSHSIGYKPVPAVLSMKECAATDIDEESK